MNRYSILAGAAALVMAMPAPAFSAPTAVVARHAAVPSEHAAIPGGGMNPVPSHFTVPFQMHSAQPSVAPLKMPQAQFYSLRPVYAWRPDYALLSNPCFLGANNLLPQQSAWENQSMPADVTIGSLAGNPSHSLLGATGSDVARMASSNLASAASAAPTSGVQFEWQPSTCAQPYL